MIKVKLINTDYNSRSDIIENFIKNFDSSGVVIKDSRNVIKSFESDKVTYNIKSFKIPNIFNAIIYNKLRSSKAERSYRYAQKLLSIGINTPDPIAYFEFKTRLFLKNSYYVSKNIEYNFSIREVIKDLNFKNRENILKLFSEFTFKLHENNINYLDHSPGNTLIKVNENKYKFYLIDLNRMEFKKMSFDDRMKNFNRLTQDSNVIKIFSEQYASLYKVDNDIIYKKMLFYSNKFFSNRSKLKKLKKFKF